ncbi:uncharacterized protein ACHE_60512A [Aspergillus chevalieri]|uniref:MULE transposase domain-containing protein n=1 Tax=Aspergillus chevalieri TaxID=182096 RepID=A0A7R7VTP5_ASPCH|nr:uncharacterized protein ACHE_60512A [Aspergillus chevalieri]BCR90626.1 hypothetical protein ACHE_60512A [Aspergillus chevalieri]
MDSFNPWDSQGPPFDISNNFVEPSAEISPEIKEPDMLIPLTRAKGSGLTTLNIEYIDDLPEYPTTHIHGYTYVIASKGRTQVEMEHLPDTIQYAKRQPFGRKRPADLHCPVDHNTSVDEGTWQEIQKSQKDVQILESDIRKRNAYSYYRSKASFFKKGHACIDQLPTCKAVFKRYNQMDVHGEYAPFIGCINGSYGGLTKHHMGQIQGHTAIDLQFLEDLFNKEILPATEECGVFEPLSSRRKYCDRDHPQGSGRLKHTPCDVIFNALVPTNIEQCPYIIFTSHGVHKHPPPPPSKAPERILGGVKRIIEQIRDPNLTTAQFLRNPQLEEFCRQYNASTLAEIHSSFCNKDRIAAIIQKQRLISYPNGQDINGLIFLQNTDQHLKDYIQEYYHDPQGIMVLCAFREQIQLLSRLSSFEIDMSYKRIRSKDINEVLFATFLPDQCKIITLLRVFTSTDSTEGYYLLFKRVFDLVQRVSSQPVLFDSIHGSGIHGIIVDMDSKQYTGLGQYLSEIDPQHQDIIWHLQRIIVFCRVHFQRSILKAIGTNNQGSPLWSRMMSLLDCRSEDDYDRLLDLLITYENANVQNWAVQKKGKVIKAGLNKACSKIQPHYFDVLRNHTNAVEQSHQKSYASGKYLTLVQAVKNSAKLDRDDIVQYNNFQDFNIHHSYRTSNMEANYLRHMSRERSRKRRRSALSISSEIESGSSASPLLPGNTRSRSQTSSRNGDNESMRSSDLRRTISTNVLNLEQRRQVIELENLEIELQQKKANLKKQEEDIRLQQLQNEKLELDLMERRMRIQEHDST